MENSKKLRKVCRKVYMLVVYDFGVMGYFVHENSRKFMFYSLFIAFGQ